MDECVHEFTCTVYRVESHYSETRYLNSTQLMSLHARIFIQIHPYVSNYTPAHVHTWISNRKHKQIITELKVPQFYYGRLNEFLLFLYINIYSNTFGLNLA